MKLHQMDTADINVVRSYDLKGIVINNDTYKSSLIVTPNMIIPNWPPQVFDDFETSHFNSIAELEPELVILGTGDSLRFPNPLLTASLTNRNIGLEVMDTPAACRTYNIVVGENRNVAAALLIQC